VDEFKFKCTSNEFRLVEKAKTEMNMGGDSSKVDQHDIICDIFYFPFLA